MHHSVVCVPVWADYSKEDIKQQAYGGHRQGTFIKNQTVAWGEKITDFSFGYVKLLLST